MREPQPQTIYLKDYAPPAFLVEHVALDVDIRQDDALVQAKLRIRRNPKAADPKAPLALDGEELELMSVAIDGVRLRDNTYSLDPERLVIPGVPDAFTLETVTRIVPHKNTKLEGLYATKSGFVTQCEAQGFRRITWFTDRPDVMARYRVTIRADKSAYPVLLSNGNRVAAADEPGGRHCATFEDPFPKPCYLFALVAARLELLEDRYQDKKLFVYVEPGKLDQAGWAMDCLKRAIAWDERRFGLALDLDEYKIVAVGDFNSGAMENKGLNIFNTKYVLARADTATDSDYLNIDRVVAHEYFHNWTGDRVTCRDWFQLSLKEGLTVFRDQEYGADSYSRAVTRIAEVRMLRAAQFPEDAGPMAHPVRPQSYMEIRNFYTMTVYEKGAEVVRMQHTLLGEERFQKGMKLYFERHDGQAVTCDDFVQAMQDASGVDLAQFRRWYDVPGTPVLDCRGEYAGGTFTLTVKQSMNPPFHIPLAVKIGNRERVLSIRSLEENFEFKNLKSKPVPSLLRGFSAPVILNYPYTEADLIHLMAEDDDAFNRWEAGQRLMATIILEHGGEPSQEFLAACARVLEAQRRRPRVRRRGAGAALGVLPRRADARGRPRRAARGAQRASTAHCRGAARAAARSLPRQRDQGPLLARRGLGRPPRAAEPVPGLPDGARRRRGARAVPRAVRARRQHDRDPSPRSACSPTATAPSASPRSSASTKSGATSRWWSTSGSRCRPPRACPARSRGCASCSRTRRSTSGCRTRSTP